MGGEEKGRWLMHFMSQTSPGSRAGLFKEKSELFKEKSEHT